MGALGLKMVRVLNVQKKLGYSAYDGVTVEVKSRIVKVTGPKGTLEKDFRHVSMDLLHDAEAKLVVCEVWYGNKKDLECTMKFVYAHFPINAHLDDNKKYIELRNFLGEKYTRVVTMRDGCEITRTSNKDEVQITGIDIEAVSQSAALVHQSTLVRHKDIRKFLDGVYVNGKGHVVEDEE